MAERNTRNFPNGASVRTGFSTTLTTPGETTSADRKIGFSNGIIWVYTITEIDTSVTMIMNVGFDGTTYGADPDSSVAHTANGTYAMTYLGTVPFARLEFDAEAGGDSSAIITVNAAITF